MYESSTENIVDTEERHVINTIFASVAEASVEETVSGDQCEDWMGAIWFGKNKTWLILKKPSFCNLVEN